GREGVAGAGYFLVAPATVGDDSAEDPEDGAHSLIDAVEDPEAERGEPDAHEVERQHGVDRLRRDVGQQAVDAEQLDVAINRPAAATTPAAGRARTVGAGPGGAVRAPGFVRG